MVGSVLIAALGTFSTLTHASQTETMISVTPSAAGEIAVQNREEIDSYINDLVKKIYQNL